MAFSPNSSIDSPKLCQDIFAILESQFLFGASSPVGEPSPPVMPSSSVGKVRILSIDGAADDDLASAALIRLESSLRRLTGDASVSISQFFDLAVSTGSGAIIASLIFANNLSASDASVVLKKIREEKSKNRSRFGGLFKKESKVLEKVFGEATLKDASKPLLVTCYDSYTRAPFVFSRADAVEADGFDFKIRDVCEAAMCARKASKEVRSVDGEMRIRVTDAISVVNPTAVGITHVMHNKQEFPFVTGLEDVFVLSVGGTGAQTGNAASIAGNCQADVVDQAVAMAFGDSRRSNYIRIQGNGINAGSLTSDDVLSEKCVESVMFQGKRLLKETNADRLEWAALELLQEQQRRQQSKIPVVFVKPAVTPRTSSSSSVMTSTSTVLTGSSESLRC